MGRRTIDFGIDLGTTNSAIGYMDKGEATVLKNYKREDYTPSVVRIDNKGTVIVGRKAYERLVDDPDNTVGEFKRLMGTQQTREFKLSGKKLKPEELSAEVLKDLKITAKKHLPNEDVDSAVITVPCNFEIVQCEATQRAANLSGIKYAPLLQEPIAASVAYGFLEKMPKGYWIVFDLGGGTFDVAIMSAKEGRLSVVDHFGDNYLGGKDFDWKIVENVIHPILAKEYNLPDLGRTAEYRALNAILKNVAEDAKIELSQRESTNITLYTDKINDKDGKPIDITIPIKRNQFVALIEIYVDKTLDLFDKVLKKQGLASSDINQLLLVGGPTQMPCIRTRLKDKYNIPTNYRIDPITVVAQGATIFAASQLIPDDLVKRDYSKVFIKLAYNPMTTEIDAAVGGRFSTSKDSPSLPDGMRVQIISESGDWDSGLIEVKEKAFFTNVTLRERKVNTFKLSLFDKSGNKIPVEPDVFSITQGISVAEPPLVRSVGVELEDGAFDKHLDKGASLPARSKPIAYRTTRTVNPGEDKNALNIHVREGESDKADRNPHVGTLKITGSMVNRTLPENSEIEVIINIDHSRYVTAEAYCPLLDQKFSEVITQKIAPKLEPDFIVKELNAEEKRLNKFILDARQTQDREVQKRLSEVNANSEINEIKGDIKAAKGGDPDAVQKADHRLKDLKQKLDSIEHLSNWPVVLNQYNAFIEDCREVVTKFGNSEDKDHMEALEEEAKKAINSKDIKRLQTINEEIISIRWVVLFREPTFWVSAFQEIKKNPGRFTNQRRAEELIEEGSVALQRQDLDSLQSVIRELWDLMPSDEQEKIGDRVSDAGIRKR